MNTTAHDVERLDLAIPYLEERVQMRCKNLHKIISDPHTTADQLVDALDAYLGTVDLMEYFKSLSTFGIAANIGELFLESPDLSGLVG